MGTFFIHQLSAPNKDLLLALASKKGYQKKNHQTFEDFWKNIPVSSPDEYSQMSPHQSKQSSQSDFLFTTSGSSGSPKYITLSYQDIEKNASIHGSGYSKAGIRPEDKELYPLLQMLKPRVLLVMPSDLFSFCQLHVHSHQMMEIINLDQNGVGELITTNLFRSHNPFLRMKTGDLAKKINLTFCAEKDQFGIQLMGRNSKIVKFGGEKFDLNWFDKIREEFYIPKYDFFVILKRHSRYGDEFAIHSKTLNLDFKKQRAIRKRFNELSPKITNATTAAPHQKEEWNIELHLFGPIE